MLIDSGVVTSSLSVSGSYNQTGNAVITGSLTVTGGITGSITSASYAFNADLLDGLDSTAYLYTSSFNAFSSSYSNRISGSEVTASVLTAASSSLSIRVSNTEATSSVLTSASGSFSTRVTNTEATASSLTTASGSFSTRVTSLETASGSFSTRTTNLETTSSNLVNASGSFSTRMTNTEATASSLVTASGSLSTRVTNTEATASNLVPRVVNLEATASNLTTASGSFSTRVTNTEATASNLVPRVVNLESTASNVVPRVVNLEATSSNLVTASGSASTRLTNLESASGSFSTRVTNTEATASNLVPRVVNLETTASNFVVTSGSASSRMTNLEATASSLTTRTTNLETASGSFSTRVTNTELTASALTTASGSFSTRVTNEEATGSRLVTASGSFSTRVTNTEATASSLVTASGSASTRLTSLESASGSFSTRVTTLESASGSTSTRLTNLETASGSFSTRVTNTEATASNLVPRVTLLETTASNFVLTSGSASSRLTNLEATASNLTTVTNNLTTASGSFSTRTTNLESTASVLTNASASFVNMSSSLSIRVTNAEASITSLNAKTGSYATTGSNTFTGTQTVQGTIIAQTLNVQQVTSSIVYSSGSNIFGKLTSDVQQFTGSLRVTGSGEHWIMGGSVGIGTTSPITTLHLQNSNSTYTTPDITNVPAIYIHNSNNNNTSAHAILALRTTGSNGGNPFISWDVKGVIGWSMGIDNADNDKLKIANYWGGVDNNTKVTIKTDGNVGIGTTDPSYKLNVISSNSTIARFDGSGITTNNATEIDILGPQSNGELNLGVGGSTLTDSTNNIQNKGFITAGSGLAGLNLRSDAGYVQITAGGVTTANEVARFTAGGNVGIGSTSPNAKLDVAGDFQANGYTRNNHTTNVVYYTSTSESFGNILAGVGGSSRAAFFRADRTDAGASVWWGRKDGSGNSVPCGAIDSADGEFTHWINSGGTTGTWTKIFTVNTSGVTVNNGNFVGNLIGTSSYASSETLATVTARGATTTTSIGIGSATAPSYPLHVRSAGTYHITAEQTSTNVNDAGAYATFYAINNATGSGTVRGYFGAGGSGVGNTDMREYVYVGAQSNNGLKFFTNDSAKMTILPGGNVGIGTTSPSYKLSIVHSGTGAAIASFQNTSSTGYSGAHILNNSGTIIGHFGYGNASIVGGLSDLVYFGSIASKAVVFTTNDSIKMTILSDGNVGIGSTSPEDKLVVSGGSIIIKGTTYPSLNLYTTSGTNWAITNRYTGNRLSIDVIGTGEIVNILSNGNVGIGTTNPTQLVEAYKSSNGDIVYQITNPNTGGSATAQFFASNGTTQTQFFHTGTSYGTSGAVVANQGGIYNTTAAGLAIIAAGAAGIIKFATGGTTEKVRIDANGSVGIGTTSPVAKLSVFTTSPHASPTGISVAAGAGGANLLARDTTYHNWFPYTDGNNYYSAGSHYFRNAAHTTDYVIINSNGNVGIGTTNPISPLHVIGSIRTVLTSLAGGDTLISAINGVSNGYRILVDTSNNITYTWSTGTNTTAMTINNSGSIGIGTTSPESILHVAQSSAGGKVIFYIDNNSSSTLNSEATIKFSVDSGASTTAGGAEISTINVNASNGNSDLTFKTFQSGVGLTEKVRIANNGSVGIGTTSPSFKLDVQGGLANFGQTATAGSAFRWGSYGTAVSPDTMLCMNQLWNGSGWTILNSDYGTTYINLGSAAASPTIQFGTGVANTAATTKMIILNNGSVGIGTTSPTSYLHVYENTDVWHTRIGGASGELRIGGQNGSGAVIQAYTPAGVARDLYIQRDGGSVGIGTTGPGEKFDVRGNSLFYGTGADTFLTVQGNSAFDPVLQLKSDQGGIASEGFQMWYINQVGNVRFATTYPDDAASFHFHTRTGASKSTANERLTILGGGNVGINTTSPAYKLDVNGTFNVSNTSRLASQVIVAGNTNTNDGTYMYDSYTDSASSYYQQPTVMIRRDSSATGGVDQAPIALFIHNENGADGTWTKLSLGSKETSGGGNTVSVAGIAAQKMAGNNGGWATGDLHLWTKYYATQTSNMILKSGGNVLINNGSLGIGTTSPVSKLDIVSSNSSVLTLSNSESAYGGNQARIDFYGKWWSGDPNGLSHHARIAGEHASGDGYHRGNLKFYTSYDGTANVDAMTIQFDGSVGINTASPGAKLHVNGTSYVGTMTAFSPAVHIRGAYYGGPRLQVYGLDADANGWMGLGTDMAAGAYQFSLYYSDVVGSSISFGRFNGGNGTRYSGYTTTALLSYAGTFTAAGDIIAYGSPSDISLKTNIKPLEGALDKIMKLQGVSFTWKEDTDASKLTEIKDDLGFIAQEVQEVLPELVRKNKDNGLLSLRDKGIIPILVEAIKEQQRQIDELKYLLQNK